MTSLAISLAPPSSPPADRRARPLVLAVVSGLTAGLLLTFGYALQPLWWTPWLAPVALLAFCRSERDGRIAGSIAGAAAMLAVWSYYLAQIGWGVALAITALRIGGWRLSARLALTAARRLPLWLAALVLPASQAGFETATLTLSPHGAAGSLAYSQMARPPLVQLASFGGVPAVVFLVLLPGSLAGLWLVIRPTRRDALAALAWVGAIGLAAAAYSAARLRPVAAAPRMSVAMIATDEMPGISTSWGKVWSAYRPAVLSVEKGTALTVLPEKVARLDMVAIPAVERDVARAARAVGTTIVVGLEVRDRIGERGRALAMDPAGRATLYDKQRMLPGFEDRDRPGHTPVVVGVAGTRVGLAICKDMHIPSIGREYDGVRVMAVGADDRRAMGHDNADPPCRRPRAPKASGSFDTEVPFAGPDGTDWRMSEEFDTAEPILPSMPNNYIERIVFEFVDAGGGRQGRVGQAASLLVDAAAMLRFSTPWIDGWADSQTDELRSRL